MLSSFPVMALSGHLGLALSVVLSSSYGGFTSIADPHEALLARGGSRKSLRPSSISISVNSRAGEILSVVSIPANWMT